MEVLQVGATKATKALNAAIKANPANAIRCYLYIATTDKGSSSNRERRLIN
jgi:hypothetical protein